MRGSSHPIIGHGPFYSQQTGIKIWYWPHNVYLYFANVVGIVGLSFFLLMMWKLVRISWPRQDDLRDPNYARAFLTVAHVQLVVFAIDELKIDSPQLIYKFQPDPVDASWRITDLQTGSPRRGAKLMALRGTIDRRRDAERVLSPSAAANLAHRGT